MITWLCLITAFIDRDNFCLFQSILMECTENEHRALPWKKADGNEDVAEPINDMMNTAETVKSRQCKDKKGPDFMYV